MGIIYGKIQLREDAKIAQAGIVGRKNSRNDGGRGDYFRLMLLIRAKFYLVESIYISRKDNQTAL